MSFLKMTHYLKYKIILGAVCLSFLFVFLPQKANAQFGIPVEDYDVEINTSFMAVDTFDIAVATDITAGASVDTAVNTSANTWAKEFLGDGVANFIAKMIVKQLTAQTVNWINSGFKGNPAFVTNPEGFFLNVGDQMAADFLTNTSLNGLCSPFQAKIRLALVKNYLAETNKNYSCTLGRLEQNFENFANNFDQGGWDGWFTMTQTTQGNPYGAYLDTKDQLSINLGNQAIKYQNQLNWGKGILSYEKCKKGATIINPARTVDNAIDPSQDPNSPTNLQRQNIVNYQNAIDKAKKAYQALTLKTTPVATAAELNAAQAAINQAQTNFDNYRADHGISDEQLNSTLTNIDSGLGEGDCAPSDKETVTPGSVISNQLDSALGQTWGELVSADEINEIVSALMTQMISHVVGGIGDGLRSLSQSDSSSNSNTGRTLMQQLVDSTASTSPETTSFNKGANSLIPSNLGGSANPTPTADTPSRTDTQNKLHCDSLSDPSCNQNSSGSGSGAPSTYCLNNTGDYFNMFLQMLLSVMIYEP